MKLELIYLKPYSTFSLHIAEWAKNRGIDTMDYDFKAEEQIADGLLLINENQTIEKEMEEIHELFDLKHIPTQKIDVNGTLQVALSNYQMWQSNYKCKSILILGSDSLVANENLDRFLLKIKAK